MKIKLLIPLLLIGSIGFSQNTNFDEKSNEISEITTLIRKDKRSSIPNFIEFQKGKEPSMQTAINLLNKYSKSKLQLEEVSRTEDNIGFTHIKFNQKINGRLVQFSTVTLHLKNNKVALITGNLRGNIPENNTVSLNEKSALKNALNKVGASIYKWEVPSEEAFIKRETGNPEATFYPKGELVYLPSNKGIRLAYRFDIYATEPLSRANYFVDANNGAVLLVNNKIHHTDVNATATTGYSGTKVIKTDSVSPTSYRLRETGRGNGIETYDMNNGSSHGSAVDFTDSDNNWTDSTNGDHYARDAHWGAEMTYDYFWTVHSRNSIDGSGFKLKSYVHYRNNYVNAYWDGNRMTYGDGNGTSTSALTTMAIAGHEITHGLTSNTANLVYSYESGALNESFSDIFGVSIDYWARPTQANWLMGDEIYITSSSYFRSMSNPNAKNDPDTYLGNHWHTSSSDNGGVHTNSGVQNFWFYLMVNGGSGTNDNGDAYNVPALGFDTASRIAFRNLTVYLNANSQYQDARFYAIKAATDLYGACSPAVIATTKAWYAVGVGTNYIPGVIADFTTLDSVSCKTPFTVNFTNNSNNATSFIWSFGDGSFSTSTSPSHTYTGYGPYNVQLIANGGTCGTPDTLKKNSYITVDTLKPCPTILTKNGNMNSTMCTGTLYDDGGASGDYAKWQNSYFRISPTSATSVTVRFPHFNIEPGSSSTCNFDYLEVYDGTSTSATLIGKYCNSTPPPSSITSTSGNIFIKFHTDGGAELSGFKMTWTCNAWTSPLPFANFTANDTIPCRGQVVNYTNASYNATSYAWTFPGGTPSSSTLANPSVAYNSAGTYSATLIATNSFGSDTIIKTNYITVSPLCSLILPAGGTAATQTGCRGKIIDDGGLTGKYSSEQTTYVTIAPTGAVFVKLDFITFDVEAEPGCIYDYMSIYDGASTSSTLIGKYCNTSTPPSSIISSGGAITIKFHADKYLQLNGFEIDWTCSLVGIDEVESINKVKIYPNPSSDYMNLEVDFNKATSIDVKLMDMLGKIHYQNKTNDKAMRFTDRVNIANLANGTYIVYVNNKAFKFVKQ